MKGGAIDADAERRDWTIEAVVPGGDGMARLDDGRVAFAEGAFPGDRILPLAVEAAKGHVRATRWELLAASPSRVAPACPVQGVCGGCNWMALSAKGQNESKAEIVRAAFERTGKLTLPDVVPVARAGAEHRYRNRVRFHIDAEGRVGFHARGTQTLVEVPGCLVCRPEIDVALSVLRQQSTELLSAFGEVEIRVADVSEGVGVSVRLFPRVRGGPPKNVRAALVETLAARYHVSIDGDPDAPDSDQRFDLPLGAILSALPGVFTQVNWEVNRTLVQAVVDGARSRGVATFCDAFAGAGNFTLPLLALGAKGIAIERDRRAISSARRAAREQGRDPGVFVAGDAAAHLKELSRRGEAFDLLLLDPPRRGAREVLSTVAAIGPPHVALCSCDPVTLARDVAVLSDSGYRLAELQAFDMFPQTHHVEVLAWMAKVPRNSSPP